MQQLGTGGRRRGRKTIAREYLLLITFVNPVDGSSPGNFLVAYILKGRPRAPAFGQYWLRTVDDGGQVEDTISEQEPAFHLDGQILEQNARSWWTKRLEVAYRKDKNEQKVFHSARFADSVPV